MKVSLNDLLPAAVAEGYAVPCFNVFGYEDASAIVKVAEVHRSPVILATNREMVEYMGLRLLATMLGQLADAASVPVCVHLDHCHDVDTVVEAVNHGYSSVMFDGSQLPLAENVRLSRQVVEHARPLGVSVEGEIGSVPYNEGRDHILALPTDPFEACAFATESGVDAVAVSVGNVHRLTSAGVTIDHDRLAAIRRGIAQPLVIHGTSGITDADQRQLAAAGVAKFNIGTSLRMSLVRGLRAALDDDPALIDRLTLFERAMPALNTTIEHHLRVLGCEGQA